MYPPLAKAREVYNHDDFIKRDVAADLSLTLGHRTVRVLADGTSGPIVLTLPNVSEAAGMIISIYAQTADATNTVTVQDQNESEGWSDVVLNADDEGLVLMSDGLKWVELVTGYS